jgi:digeranylgeranylglycerophospholipid reductase
MKCDILIIGCGPAGSSCAIEAAKYANDVIIVDKRKSIGEPVECAEFVPKLLFQEIDIGKKCIVQEINKIKLFTLKGLVKEFDSPGYMINRATFDKELALKAVNNGVKLLINTRCFNKNANHLHFMQGPNLLTISAQVVIGADGPLSIVGSWINKKQKDFVLGMGGFFPKGMSLTLVVESFMVT